MFKGNGSASQARRIDVLQKRCDRVTAEYEILKSEKAALENELEVCKAKLVCVEKAEKEFMENIAQAKQVREQYERAYEDLKVLKSRYAAEVNKLIRQMKH